MVSKYDVISYRHYKMHQTTKLKSCLRDIIIILDIIGEKALLLEVRYSIRHDVVERVVASLQRLLVGQPTLLQQVDNHVST